jgi:hypothetical protein
MSLFSVRTAYRASAITIALILSATLISAVEAKPKWKHWHKRQDHGAAWWKKGKPHPRYYHGQEYRYLPSGCRRVVIRQRVYYTNNDVYFVYSPIRNVYIVANPWSW